MAASMRRVFRGLLALKCGQRSVITPHGQNKTQYNTFLAQIRNSSTKSFQERASLMCRDVYSRYPTKTSLFVLSGVLGFFGLEKDQEENEDELVNTIKRSIILIQRGEFNAAERMLHLGLKLAQQRQDPDGVTYIYDLLANLALEKGDLAKAEKLFVSVMQRLMTAGVKQDDNRIIHASLKVAQMHSENTQDKKGNPEKAEEGFRYCVEGLRKKVNPGGVGENDEDTVLLLALAEEGYARFCLSQNRLKESQQLLEKAVEHLEKGISLGTRGPDEELRTALMLNDLGSLCSLNGDQALAVTHLGKAIECGERGVKLRREARKPMPPGIMGDEELVASLRINLGVVYAKMGMFELAHKSCQDGWKAAKRLKQNEVLKEADSCLDEVKKLMNGT
ncbi:tetratricopeptide repeat protein 19 homolog, mitochondrial [Ischnura elegans]|uniref:tetratricopeptide repeat protein 19 homolog, mitochondrial n=1 Tax=Ischnura elegans TaxID=197161 RepID=UPI001ED8688B|nr:tetratricopeptide repeat protein 19 homolog, mitochondrial [Ischnura elegans]